MMYRNSQMCYRVNLQVESKVYKFQFDLKIQFSSSISKFVS